MSQGRDFRFARTPKWVVGHVLAVVAIIVFVQLGLWQLDRLNERREFNAAITENLERGVMPLADLLLEKGDDPTVLRLHRVVVVGAYDDDEEVIIQGRSHQGRSGHHVVTPLVVGEGRGVIVNRGWVPIDSAGPPVPDAAVPPGSVEVRGIIRESQQRRPFQPTADAGRLDRMARIDVPRIQGQSAHDLYGFYIDLERQTPSQVSTLPVPVEPPAIGEGPHLSYAIQWLAFAGVVVIGYPILLSRTALRRGATVSAPAGN